MKSSTLLSIPLLIISSYANAESFNYNGHTYELVQTARTWDQAKANARNGSVAGANGYLAQIGSEAENSAIFNFIRNNIKNENNSISENGGGDVYVWLGGSDKTAEGRWVWNKGNIYFWQGRGSGNNGKPVGRRYSQWGGNAKHQEPDNWVNANLAPNGQDGLAMSIKHHGWPWGNPGDWNDVALNDHLYYVVEYNAVEDNNPKPPVDIAKTVYEDGKSSNDWRIISGRNNAHIRSTYDQDKQSSVISLSGNGVSTQYALGDYAGMSKAWGNKKQHIIRWSMKYSENFTVYIKVRTKDGRRNIYYRPQDDFANGKKPNTGNILHGIGATAKNGVWQTFTRDLRADLKEYDPTNELISVDGFYVRGSGRIDNIEMINPSSNKRVFVLGSSTVHYNYVSEDGRVLDGWGEHIHKYLINPDKVQNRGRAGTHSVGYRTRYNGSNPDLYGRDRYWGDTERRIKASEDDNGGFLLIQFGAVEGYSPEVGPADFMRELRAYISDARRLNLTPVLISPISSRGPKSRPYAKYIKQVADKEQVLFLDLHGRSQQIWARYRGDYNAANRAFGYLPFDGKSINNTHLSPKGANIVAGWVKRLACQSKTGAGRSLCKQFTPTTIYDNGASTNNWRVYSGPNTARITSLFDKDRGSYVVQLKGQGTESQYAIGNYSSRKDAWGNKSQFIIRWSMKFSENFTVYVKVRTKDGRRNIYYRPQNSSQDGKKPGTGNILYGLGVSAKDGKWHTFTRDLQTDLKKYDPSNELISVDGIFIRGSGLIDDIMTMPHNKPQDNPNPNPPGVIGTGLLKIKIKKNTHGIEIANIRRNALNLLTGAKTDLFTLTVQDTQNKREETIKASSGWDKVTVRTSANRATITLRQPRNRALPRSLKAVISISTKGGTSAWDLNVSGLGQHHSLMNAKYPDLKIKANGNDHFFAPYYYGKLFNNPGAKTFSYATRYPRGWGGTMQYMAYYNKQYGLYFGMHDPKASIKDFSAKSVNGGIEVFESTPAANKTLANNTWDLPGHFELDLFKGDWYDAAMKYRRWVYAKADYRPVDTPQRLARQRNLGNIVMWAHENARPYTTNQLETHVRGFKDYMDVPVGIHWNAFNGEKFDTLYPEIFPEKPGLKGVISRLNNTYGKNIHLSGYMNGMLYDTEFLPSYSSVGKPMAVRDSRGNVRTYLANREWKVIDGVGRFTESTLFAYMCPSQNRWQGILSDSTRRMTKEIGFDGAYIDMITASAAQECYNSSHHHTLGGGSYWRDGYKKMFQRMHREAKSGSSFYSEEANDFIADEIDGFLTIGYMTNNQVPALSAVYADKLQFIGTNIGWSGYKNKAIPDSQHFYGTVAQSFSFGAQLGRFYMGMTNTHHPRSMRAAKFVRGLGRIKHKLKQYLSFGRMLKPVKLNGNIPEISLRATKYPKIYQESVVTPAIQTSTWTDGKNIAVLFINAKVPDHTGDRINFSFDFDGAKYGIKTDTVRVKEVIETSNGHSESSSRSFTKNITLKSYEAKVILISPTK